MPRKKLTEEEKAERKAKQEAKRIADNLAFNRKNLENHPWLPEPTYTFEVGDEVKYGSHDKTVIDEVCDGGKFYLVTTTNTKKDRWEANERIITNQSYVEWHSLNPIKHLQDEPFFRVTNLFLSFSNCDIFSLIHKVLSDSAGVDFSPDYQRDYVWTMDDKISLIDSIYSGADIGKFVFKEVDFVADEPGYEIIDGKQRLSTIVDFYCGKFPYRGYCFHEMHPMNRNEFINHSVSWATLKNADEEDILEVFLRLNTGGRVMKPTDLAYAKNRLAKLRKDREDNAVTDEMNREYGAPF